MSMDVLWGGAQEALELFSRVHLFVSTGVLAQAAIEELKEPVVVSIGLTSPYAAGVIRVGHLVAQ